MLSLALLLGRGSSRPGLNRTKRSARTSQLKQRRLQIEPLEARQLLSVSPAFNVNNANSSNSLGVTASVSPPVQQAATTTALSSSSSWSVYGQAVTITAMVSGPGGGTPTGSVYFCDQTTGQELGRYAVDGTGNASFTTSDLDLGGHWINTIYSGDSNFAASSASLDQHVLQYQQPTTISVGASSANGLVTLTATVSGEYGGTPSGSVGFYDGSTGQVLGSSSLNVSGNATVSTSTLSSSDTGIIANYSGDGNFAASSGSMAQMQITPSFVLTGPTAGTFTAGQTVTIQWTASNVDSGSSVSLAYDTTTTWSNAKWIEIGAVTAANGQASFGWNTAGIAAGTYYLEGYLWDNNQGYFSNLPSSISITAAPTPSFAMTGPTSGTYNTGQMVTIQWTATNVAAGSSVSLAYDTTTNWGNPTWIEIGVVTAANGSASYSWNTTGVAVGTYYMAGYLWDANQSYLSHLVSAITITDPELFAYRPNLGDVHRGPDGHHPMVGRQRRFGQQHQSGLRHDH